MCARRFTIEEIPLTELDHTAYAVLSRHLDALHTRRKDWKGIAKAINLDYKEMNLVEASNEHMKKLIEIWNRSPPYPVLKDLLEVLEELGCDLVITELRECFETLPCTNKKTSSITHDVPPQPIQVSGPTLISPQTVTTNNNLPVNTVTNYDSSPIAIPSNSPVPSSKEYETISKPIVTEMSEKDLQIKDGFFVSFHENDAHIGREIIDEMRQKGIQIYSQDDIYAGDSEIQRREELFVMSKSVIAVISPDYCEKEGYHQLEALSKLVPSVGKRTFIPVIYKQVEVLPSFIRTRSKVDWRRPDKFTHLYNSIKNI
ncbi:hypothetical protein LOD99_9727 [Oopsacas minuta]|uniref:Death domain-containing protein n=1 Tax=Oopsacas minuta TaxID=111878 RepID=A0AAV7KQX3_9METZ|nr:hypothetical protein LOD99_9727 [Oopsacas minuta]